MYWDDLYHYCRVSCQNQLSLKKIMDFKYDDTSFCFNVTIHEYTTPDTTNVWCNIVTRGKSTRSQWYSVHFSFYVWIREEVFHEEILPEKWTNQCTLGTCPETAWSLLIGVNIIVIVLISILLHFRFEYLLCLELFILKLLRWIKFMTCFPGKIHDFYIAGFGKKYSTYEID